LCRRGSRSISVANSAEPSQVQRLSGSERYTLGCDLFPGIARFTKGRSSSAFRKIRFGLDVCPVLNQELNCSRMTFIRGPHQCGGPSQGFLRVHVGTVIEQSFYRIHIS
jgi:hypothetical protein